MVGMAKVNKSEQPFKPVRKRVIEASQISLIPRDQRVTGEIVVHQFHRSEFDEAQLCGIFFERCIATKLKEIIPCLSIVLQAERNSFTKSYIATELHIPITLCSILL
jgi:hypothetical protein